jgi:hypothetical protein
MAPLRPNGCQMPTFCRRDTLCGSGTSVPHRLRYPCSISGRGFDTRATLAPVPVRQPLAR